jgi:nitroreductase
MVHTCEIVDSHESADSLWSSFEAVASARHCKRAFLDRPVERHRIERVLATATHAPSTRNGQPWRVAVVTGPALADLVGSLCDVFDQGIAPDPDYANRPIVTEESIEDRARAAGAGVLRARGIARDDGAARRAHLRDNLGFYGAPVAMVFHLRRPSPPGAFLEMGLYLQNVMLGLVAQGLGSCPQYSVAGYPDVLRHRLGLGDDRLIVCGLAVGCPDPAAAVNAFAPDRIPVAQFVRWHDQAEPLAGADR